MVVSKLCVIAVQLIVCNFVFQYLIMVCVLWWLKSRAIMGALLLDSEITI